MSGNFAAVAREVAAPTAAIAAARNLLLEGATGTLRNHLDAEAATIAAAGAHPESREGVAAFLTRRKPVFPGA
jgi:2-(1,2-epoxy-1,2-dihydrophenyl)acetyl-CoA isomerase